MSSFYQRIILIIVFFATSQQFGWGQLQIDTVVTPEQLIYKLLGQGVEVSNIQFHGSGVSKGIFRNGGSTELGIDSGIFLTTGYNSKVANVSSVQMSDAIPPHTNDSDPDLNNLLSPSAQKHDATAIEFDFIPFYDTIRIKYVFGSEEYPEYACSSYNDIFAFFLSSVNPTPGNYNYQNIAKVPETNYAVSINCVNNGPGAPGGEALCIPPGSSAPYSKYYVDNENNTKSKIVFDGFTVILTAYAVVIPCQTYHMKIAIQEVGDNGFYDSGVFLKAGSFSSPGVALEPVYTTPGNNSFAVEGCTQADLKVTLPFANPNISWVVFDSITGSATNGVDYNLINDSVMFLPNQLTVTIPIVPVYDALTEGDENIFIYLSNQVGCAGVNVQRTEIQLRDFSPVEIGSDTTVCGGTLITFDAGGGYKTYTWHNGSHGQTWTSPGIPPGEQVSVAVEDSWGCTSSDTLQLTIHPRPVINPIRHD